jgi:hypothetical protein
MSVENSIIITSGVGCAIVDLIYNEVSFEKILKTGGCRLSTGKLVFTDEELRNLPVRSPVIWLYEHQIKQWNVNKYLKRCPIYTKPFLILFLCFLFNKLGV